MSRGPGNFYAYAREMRGDKTYPREVARQAQTFGAAWAALDATGSAGYVQCWSDQTQARHVVAERTADGTWYTIDPMTGARKPLPR